MTVIHILDELAADLRVGAKNYYAFNKEPSEDESFTSSELRALQRHKRDSSSPRP